MLKNLIKKTDKQMKDYFTDAKRVGSPFFNDASYNPLTSELFSSTLYDFKIKKKSSPLIQFADFCLWPMVMGGYDPSNRAYKALREAGQLIDCKIPPERVSAEGIKYSCWELVGRKN
jgi:hypothetical protein